MKLSCNKVNQRIPLIELSMEIFIWLFLGLKIYSKICISIVFKMQPWIPDFLQVLSHCTCLGVHR